MNAPLDAVVAKFYYTQHDTARPLACYLEDINGNAQNLNGATVTFSMATKRKTPVAKIVEADCQILDAATGKIQYNWTDADVDTVGEFYGQFKVTFPSTKPMSFPSAPKPYDFIVITFQPDI